MHEFGIFFHMLAGIFPSVENIAVKVSSTAGWIVLKKPALQDSMEDLLWLTPPFEIRQIVTRNRLYPAISGQTVEHQATFIKVLVSVLYKNLLKILFT